MASFWFQKIKKEIRASLCPLQPYAREKEKEKKEKKKKKKKKNRRKIRVRLTSLKPSP